MTIEQLRQLIEDLPDDFVFEITVCNKEKGFFLQKKFPKLKKQDYEIVYSDKVLTLSLDITDF